MSFLENARFNETNTAAGIPIVAGRFAYLSVPLGLACVNRQLYDKKRNIERGDTISDAEFNSMEERVQHKNTTRSARHPLESKKATKRKRIKLN